MPALAEPAIVLTVLVYLALVVATALAGIWICQQASDRLGVHDHPGIVWDEFAGFTVAVLYLPQEWPVIMGALIAFRIFDVFKPFPGGRAQKLPRGWGIMMDDLVAGVYANLAVRAAIAVLY